VSAALSFRNEVLGVLEPQHLVTPGRPPCSQLACKHLQAPGGRALCRVLLQQTWRRSNAAEGVLYSGSQQTCDTLLSGFRRNCKKLDEAKCDETVGGFYRSRLRMIVGLHSSWNNTRAGFVQAWFVAAPKGSKVPEQFVTGFPESEVKIETDGTMRHHWKTGKA
jgi:hypothetical protein